MSELRNILLFGFGFSRVDDYIKSGLEDAIVDPDPDLIYTKRKIAREQASSSHGTVASTSTNASSTYVSKEKIKVNFPTSRWGNSLQKMPFFSRAEKDKFVALTGKSFGCAGKKSVPTGLKKATTFLKDEYLKLQCPKILFSCVANVITPFERTIPNNVFLALCIVSGEVKDSKCSRVAGSSGYCNHSLALMLKACKFQKGRGETIYPQPVMDVVVSKTKLEDSKRGKQGIHSPLYEARNNVMYNSAEEQKFKQAIRDINPQMGLAQIVTLGSETHLKETRFGYSLVVSYVSYQLTHTESNFNVCVDISSVPRGRKNNQQLT